MSETKLVTIFIDNTAYQVDANNNLLAGVLSNQLNLPYFCWHPEMGSVGACRQCAVTQFQDENDTRGRTVMACTTPVSEGLRIGLKDKSSSEFREQVISAMMTNHPHDCPVCAEGGECHLQDMTVMTGHNQREYQGLKRTFTNQNLGEFIGHEMNRCITCYRCHRFYNDYAGGKDFAVFGSKNQVYFGRQSDGQFESEFSGNLVEICPTGVFTNKLFSAHYTRKWDLQSAPSICAHCSVGCNTSVGERYGTVRRVVNRFHENINGYFLCDKGRFGIGFVNANTRLTKEKGIRKHVTKTKALTELDIAKAFSHFKQKTFLAIGSGRASSEANALLQSLVGNENYSPGWSNEQLAMASLHASLVNDYAIASTKDIEVSDFICIFNEDITLSAPILALSVRQMVKKAGIVKAQKMGVQYWQNNAVQTIAGSLKAPVLQLSSSGNKLADISQNVLLKAPAHIQACFTELIQEAQNNGCKTNKIASNSQCERTTKFINQFIEQIRSSKQPVFITGWQAGSKSLAMFRTLMGVLGDKFNKTIKLVVVPPAANSMSLISRLTADMLSIEHLKSKAKTGNYDGLVILENELDQLTLNQQQELCSLFRHTVVIEHSYSRLYDFVDIVLPTTAISESEGHFVNYEGRIQRFIPAHLANKPIQDSWRWLVSLARAIKPKGDIAKIKDFEDVQLFMQSNINSWPKTQKFDAVLARETHRASGRTAKRANINIHESQTPQSSSEFSFSMEGSTLAKLNSTSQPFVWSPGWNSNQGINIHSPKLINDKFMSFKKSEKLLESLLANNIGFIKEPEGTAVLKSGWFLSEWQLSLSPDFHLAQPDNRIYVSNAYAEKNGLKNNCYGFLSITRGSVKVDEISSVVEICIDNQLEKNHMYGHVKYLINNCCSNTIQDENLLIKPATKEQVLSFVKEQDLQRKSWQEQQASVLEKLKKSDQMIPIRLMQGGLDDG